MENDELRMKNVKASLKGLRRLKKVSSSAIYHSAFLKT
jgi:hypothetical protein